MTRTLGNLCLVVAGLLMVTLLTAPASAQLDTLWTGTYGGPENDGFRSVVPTQDGGFVAVGYTYSFGDADVNLYAVKTGGNGAVLWSKAYGGSGRDYGYGAYETADGGYVFTGYTTSVGAGKEDVYLVRTDVEGDTLWTRTYGGAEPDEGRSVCETSDGGFLITGRTESFGSGQNDLYVLKTDADGDTLWTRVFGGPELDWGTTVCETYDGCYGIAGTTGSRTNNLDIYLIKLEPNGNTVFENGFGDSGDINPDWGTGICSAPDTGLVVCGSQGIEGIDPLDGCWLRTDAAGIQTSYRRYSVSYYQYCRAICTTFDDGYLMCGAVKDPDTQKNDLFLLKRRPGSGWVFSQSLGGAGSDWGSSVAEDSPGKYIVAGHTESYGAGGFDGWLIRLRDPTSAVPAEESRARKAFMSMPSPNPFNPMTGIRLGIAETGPVHLAVYDVSGRRVALLVDSDCEAGEFTVVWDGRDDKGIEVGSGIYLARVVTRGFSATRKMVLLK